MVALRLVDDEMNVESQSDTIELFEDDEEQEHQSISNLTESTRWKPHENCEQFASFQVDANNNENESESEINENETETRLTITINNEFNELPEGVSQLKLIGAHLRRISDEFER